jgi:hypothetical protein
MKEKLAVTLVALVIFTAGAMNIENIFDGIEHAFDKAFSSGPFIGG